MLIQTTVLVDIECTTVRRICNGPLMLPLSVPKESGITYALGLGGEVPRCYLPSLLPALRSLRRSRCMRRSYILLQTFLILLLVAATVSQQCLHAQEPSSIKQLLPALTDEFTPDAPPLFLWVAIPASSAPDQ